MEAQMLLMDSSNTFLKHTDGKPEEHHSAIDNHLDEAAFSLSMRESTGGVFLIFNLYTKGIE